MAGIGITGINPFTHHTWWLSTITFDKLEAIFSDQRFCFSQTFRQLRSNIHISNLFQAALDLFKIAIVTLEDGLS